MIDRLSQQIEFLLELDKLKSVLRRSYLSHDPRRENSAEHSWHVVMAAVTLAEYANEPIDIGHVMKLLLLHDVVEIDAGDTFIYDTTALLDQADRETLAAQRIFGLLPDDQRDQFVALWQEYEARATPEARFARSIDRLMPVLHNCSSQGRGWQENGVHQGQVVAVNCVMEDGSAALWQFMRGKIQAAVDAGHLPAAPV